MVEKQQNQINKWIKQTKNVKEKILRKKWRNIFKKIKKKSIKMNLKKKKGRHFERRYDVRKKMLGLIW